MISKRICMRIRRHAQVQDLTYALSHARIPLSLCLPLSLVYLYVISFYLSIYLSILLFVHLSLYVSFSISPSPPPPPLLLKTHKHTPAHAHAHAQVGRRLHGSTRVACFSPTPQVICTSVWAHMRESVNGWRNKSWTRLGNFWPVFILFA